MPETGSTEETTTTTSPSGSEHVVRGEPFKHLQTQTVFDGVVFRVERRSYMSPDGQVFHREVVVTGNAVAVVPIVNGTTVLMCKHWRASHGGYLYEIPAGKLDIVGEDPEDAAKRELKEELGYVIDPHSKFTHLLDYKPAVGFAEELVKIYLAEDVEFEGTDRHGAEERYIEEVQVDLKDAVTFILNGWIVDSKTIIGLMLAKEALGVR